MKPFLLPALFLLTFVEGFGQAATKVAALNNYVAYANSSAEDATFVFNRVVSYYPRIRNFKKNFQRPSYVCDNQLDDRLFNKAIAESQPLGNFATGLNAKVRALKLAAEKVDEKCKALDTYHKLEDYERDNFKQAYVLINEMQVGLVDYRAKLQALVSETESVYQKIQPVVPGNGYHQIDQMMKKEIAREKSFLDSLGFNVEEDIPTGWNVDGLQRSILDTEQAMNRFAANKIVLKYPATNMIGAFKEDLESFLSSKRNGLDGYNFEARKSDKHSNSEYVLFMSYYSNLVHDRNQFLEFAKNDGFYGLASPQFIALFEIRTTGVKQGSEVTPFKDISYKPIKPVKQGIPVPKPVIGALANYVEFINESVDQISYLNRVLRGVNSSATYYYDLTSYKGKGGLTYKHDDYEIPLSLYQKAITQSSAIPLAYRKGLNDQAEVILNILKELDALSIAISLETGEKRYEKDNLKHLYELFARNAELFGIIDARKEQLYLDCRAIFESYATPNAQGSWQVSNKALLHLVDEDKTQLFKAKAYFSGDATSVPSSAEIVIELRDIIAKEFINMKGIERLGRYNGNCPYTPYENVPGNSKTLGEKIDRIDAAKTDSYEGPYHDFVYMYNVIAEDYNKFCELAKVDLLQTDIQPELFIVEEPEHKKTESDDEKPTPANKGFVQEPQTILEEKHDVNPTGPSIETKPAASHSTTLVQRQRTDTVYIHDRDTIYIDHPVDENPGSLDGYASNNLVFLLDVSGSMKDGPKLPLLKKSMLVLVNMMRPEDHVTVVVYSGKARVVLPSTSCADKGKIKRVIEDLEGDGYTDGNAGIQLAYKVADESYIRGGNNRIVLATDGEFGVSNPTLKLVDKFSNQDIFLSVFVFGKDSGTSRVLAKLSATGKGHYEMISAENSDSKLIGEAKAKRKK